MKKKRRVYKKLKAGDSGWCDWQSPIHGSGDRNYRFACCDCDLVHEMQFRVVKQESGNLDVVFRVKRNNRATSAKRRSKKLVTTN